MHDTPPADHRGGLNSQGASEPRDISLLEWDAARHVAGHPNPDLHKSKWPGRALREAPQAPQVFRGHRSWIAEPRAVPKKPKPAPKIPRNTEPCPLWQFVAIFLAVGGAAFATAAYGLWWLQDLLTWAGL